jgi:hypothetical protein
VKHTTKILRLFVLCIAALGFSCIALGVDMIVVKEQAHVWRPILLVASGGIVGFLAYAVSKFKRTDQSRKNGG